MSRRRHNSQRVQLRLGVRGLGAAVLPVGVQRILPRAWTVRVDPALRGIPHSLELIPHSLELIPHSMELIPHSLELMVITPRRWV